MYIREKTARGHSYLYLVESVREGGRVRQRTLAALGRKEVLQENGTLERLAEALARHSERAVVLSQMAEGSLVCRRIGAPMLFGRLWDELGVPEVLAELLAGRGFAFSVERAVFTAVLHRIMAPGSDRACEKWMADHAIPGSGELDLHHFYRAMAWLGEELAAGEQADATPFAPRCVKDLVEERLFQRRRDLFSELSLVFLDTTSLSFHGAGGAGLGRHGHSKDHRPELKQMIVAFVVDGDGRPLCSEMWPGNTADVHALLPIIDRLRGRFAIGRVCVVADRGMIAAATIKGLEERGLEYVLGVRERSDKIVRDLVLKDATPMAPLVIERGAGETQLFVKEVRAKGRRYIVCRNEQEAEKDRATRQAVVDSLHDQLSKGDKALIRNTAYRRYLRKTDQSTGAFEIDPAKLAEEAKFDGVFVLRTNTRLNPAQAVLRYRELMQVEELFRTAKAVMNTRPIYHQTDAAIRGHVFCSFLALVLRKELQDRCARAGLKPEWGDLLRDLDRLQEATVEKDGKRVTVRTAPEGQVGRVFQAAGIALPPTRREHPA